MLVAVAVGFGGFVAAGTARAYTFACDSYVSPPSGTSAGTVVPMALNPSPFVGTSAEQAQELFSYFVWLEAYNQCRVVQERLGAIDADTDQLALIQSAVLRVASASNTLNLPTKIDSANTKLDGLSRQLDTLGSKLDQLHADLTASSPVSGTVDLGTATLDAQRAWTDVLHRDVWMLLGAMVGLYVMGAIVRRLFA